MGVIDDIKNAAGGVKETLKQYDTIGNELHNVATQEATPEEAARARASKMTQTSAPRRDSGKRYGDKPGEKRIDVKDMLKPLPSYKKGTSYVPKTGPAMLHKGEAVVTAEDNKMDAKDAMAGITGKKASQKPPKKIKEIRTKMSDNGKVVHTHVHHHPEHHADETHVSDNAAGAAKHMTDMMPNMSAQPPEHSMNDDAAAVSPVL